MPISGINMTYNNTGVIGPQDCDIQIKLKEGHRPTDDYVQALREQLPRQFPGFNFAFLPADIVNQILNFGAPARYSGGQGRIQTSSRQKSVSQRSIWQSSRSS
jgi:hypothetical protein